MTDAVARPKGRFDPRRRRLWRAALGVGVGVGAGFGVAAPARACDFFTANLRINPVWARATGNAPFAVVCMTFDEVAADDRLIGIDTPIAAAGEIGGPTAARPTVDFFIPGGRTTVLDEAGPHLRLTGLRRPLVFGASYPLTLVFERGGPVLADIDVVFSARPSS